MVMAIPTTMLACVLRGGCCPIRFDRFNSCFKKHGLLCAGCGPEWGAASAHAEVYSDDQDELPLNGMNIHNACQFTSCPIRASTKQSYTYTLPLAKKFPVVCSAIALSLLLFFLLTSECVHAVNFQCKNHLINNFILTFANGKNR